MKIAAVIAECNPFHKGHEYLIRTVREETGADRVFLLMSGEFVQRGVPAVTERRVRTEMALRGGADAVFSYPLRYSVSSAESFASHAVTILNGFRCVDFLAFGSESGNLKELNEAASYFLAEPEEYREELKEGLREGINFAKARAGAAGKYAGLIASPNNILAVEYLKALQKSGSPMLPFTTCRITDAADGPSMDGISMSGTGIRKSLADFFAGNTNLLGTERQIPEAALPVLLRDLEAFGTVTAEDFSVLLFAELLKAGSPEELTSYAEVSSELARSIFAERIKSGSFDAFSALLHTKNRTRAAVNRALLHIVLGIKETREDVHFTQLLGFRKDASDLLHVIRNASDIPIVTKAADAGKILKGKALEDFGTECRACDLYEAIRAQNTGSAFRPELSKNVVIV